MSTPSVGTLEAIEARTRDWANGNMSTKLVKGVDVNSDTETGSDEGDGTEDDSGGDSAQDLYHRLRSR